MSTIEEKFKFLETENAPGQELLQSADQIGNLMRGAPLPGPRVDFSHGDVDAFTPTPGALDQFLDGVSEGGRQAYTEYMGSIDIREMIAPRLAEFTGAPVGASKELIITPGTQGALFLAVAATVASGDKVAIVEPDYFANRKLVHFFGGVVAPVPLSYENDHSSAGIDLDPLENSFRSGVKTFLFSNPNNPTGVVYSAAEIEAISALASRYGVTVIVDQLYSRLLYSGASYSHLRAQAPGIENLITIMGPSKTESLSGYRLGVAFGSAAVISRMEKLQAIVSLRAGGYSQAVLKTWFAEPDGWMKDRIRLHETIRDDLTAALSGGVTAAVPMAGSYLFPTLPPLAVGLLDFVKLLREQANVIVTPGTEFSPKATSSVRLNFSQNHGNAVDAMRRICAMAERYRS